MGFLDGLLGRKKPARPNLDALFAIPAAAITLQVSMDFLSTGQGAVAFRSVEGRAFADIEAEVRALLDAAPCEVTVSLEDRTVTMPDGRSVAFPLDDKVRENLLNGWDDIALTLLREDKIAEYERTRERQGPSTLSLG